MSVEIAFELVYFAADAFDFAGLVAAGGGKQAEFGDVALQGVNYALLLLVLFAARGGGWLLGSRLLGCVRFCGGVRIIFFFARRRGVLGRGSGRRLEIRRGFFGGGLAGGAAGGLDGAELLHARLAFLALAKFFSENLLLGHPLTFVGL